MTENKKKTQQQHQQNRLKQNVNVMRQIKKQKTYQPPLTHKHTQTNINQYQPTHKI